MTANEWPRRSSMCLDCRTALTGTSTCPANPRHGVVSLTDERGREALRTTVWGPPSVRARAKQAAKAGGGGAAGGAVAEGCGSCTSCDAGAVDPQALLVIAALALAFVIAYFLGSFIARQWRRYKSRIVPNGAVRAGLSAGHGHGRSGTVIATATASAPIGAEPCVAFGYELRHKQFWRKGKTTLRDAATIGFDIALDTGERVRIPAGIIALDMRAAKSVQLASPMAADYLKSIDERRDGETSGDHDPIPFNEIRQAIVEAGARVEVRGPLEPRPDVNALPGDYREQAPTVLVPVGVPRLALAPSG